MSHTVVWRDGISPTESDEEFQVSKKITIVLRRQIGAKITRRNGRQVDGYKCDEAGWVDIQDVLECQFIWTEKNSAEARNERYYRWNSGKCDIGRKRMELLMKLSWINGGRKQPNQVADSLSRYVKG